MPQIKERSCKVGGGFDEAGRSCKVSAQQRRFNREHYLEGILAGRRTVLAQAITLIESSRAADRELAEQIVEDCLPYTGRALRVGVTGVPGAGKSTLIEALGRRLIDEYGQKVAVLAIDPTSQRSGGSILGDKTRMVSLAASERAFIRPSPSRGSFGGVAQHTREAMLLCEAAGYENILVETVGVGQSETAVHRMVDFFLLVMIAGAGDELQGLKRGVMELADCVVINKADSGNEAAAEKARGETANALHFYPPAESAWTPRVFTCSALAGRGVAELWTAVLEHSRLTQANGWLERNRRDQRRHWMREAIEQGLARLFRAQPEIQSRMDAFECEVIDGRITPFRAARTLLEMYAAQRSGS